MKCAASWPRIGQAGEACRRSGGGNKIYFPENSALPQAGQGAVCICLGIKRCFAGITDTASGRAMRYGPFWLSEADGLPVFTAPSSGQYKNPSAQPVWSSFVRSIVKHCGGLSRKPSLPFSRSIASRAFAPEEKTPVSFTSSCVPKPSVRGCVPEKKDVCPHAAHRSNSSSL